jgi:glyoxylate/hydroxypyruvate reductase A
VFYSRTDDPAPWQAAIVAAVPAVTFRVAPHIGPVDAVRYALVWKPPRGWLAQFPNLSAILSLGAGVDALLQLRLPPGVPLVRLDDAGMSVQMAEYVCHAVIRHFRELDGYDTDTQAGQWSYRKPRRRADFAVGVMGLGILGERVAKALQVFDFPVNGFSRSAKNLAGVRCFSGAQGLQDFLAASRVMVNLLPLTPETENILNHATLSQLPKGGYLINVARGKHLVDEDLIALIDSGHLAGATLDVFRTEPLPAAHPFWQHPQITVTPHTSARTLRDERIEQIVGKIQALQRGEAINGVVDPQRGY